MLLAINVNCAVENLIAHHEAYLRSKVKQHDIVGDFMRLLDGDLRQLILLGPFIANFQIRMAAVINPLIEEPVV